VQKDEITVRVGGDEVIVAGIGAKDYTTVQSEVQALRSRRSILRAGEFHLTACVIDYAGPSIGVVAVNPSTSTPDKALQQADLMMFVDKHRRKKQA
jgi:diguanylate cyclase